MAKVKKFTAQLINRYYTTHKDYRGIHKELEIWKKTTVHKSQDKYQVIWSADLRMPGEPEDWRVMSNPSFKTLTLARKWANGVMREGTWVKIV